MRQLNRLSRLLGLAQLGHAHWLFGNIYEAVVKIPDRLAAEPRPATREGGSPRSSLLAPGSPLRYSLPPHRSRC
ncbi:hypothetical protein MPRS_43080 [Mycobacterium paraseoulense]|nr:hypothetical protein MPRS_43080 [Mycobacterium paraseoulense]